MRIGAGKDETLLRGVVRRLLARFGHRDSPFGDPAARPPWRVWAVGFASRRFRRFALVEETPTAAKLRRAAADARLEAYRAHPKASLNGSGNSVENLNSARPPAGTARATPRIFTPPEARNHRNSIAEPSLWRDRGQARHRRRRRAGKTLWGAAGRIFGSRATKTAS